MRSFFVLNENINGSTLKIFGDDFSHIKNVLRLQVGEKIIAICGDGKEYISKISNFEKDHVECEIEEIKISDKTPKTKITLFQALPKGDKFEFIIQKMAELGIKEVIPFESTFTIAKAKDGKLERWNKISIEASKQCKRAEFLEVKNCLKFADVLKLLKNYDQVLFAYENESVSSLRDKIQKAGKNIAFIVGSEGGFSEQESKALVENGAVSVSLGKRILRAETAAVAFASVIAYELGEWEV